MFPNDKNLRDNIQNNTKDTVSAPVSYGQKELLIGFYPKIKKLTTALYMVTDIMDKDEPIRLKLRTLGVEILSDTGYSSRTDIGHKIHSIVSFMDIAFTIGLISEMNFNILKKEFTELSHSIKEKKESNVENIWLEEFLRSKDESLEPKKEDVKIPKNTQNNSGFIDLNREEDAYPALKKQRREDILKAIKENGGIATITEVKMKAPDTLSTHSEKTLQRELVAMVRDGILSKTGEKRWSRYSLL